MSIIGSPWPSMCHCSFLLGLCALLSANLSGFPGALIWAAQFGFVAMSCFPMMKGTPDQPCCPHLVWPPCQASLSVTICMRVGSSKDQLLADSLGWSEQLRVEALAGCDDVMEMVSKVCQMQAFTEGTKGNVQMSAVLKTCADWGLRWHGKPIERQTWNAIQSIMPFCRDGAVLSALAEIKCVYPEIDRLTTLSKICKVATTFFKGSFLCHEFQEKPAPGLALEWAFHWFYYGLQFGDFEKGEVNIPFLVGRVVSEVGSFQVFFRKLQGLDFVWRHYQTSPAFDPEVSQTLSAKFSSLGAFVAWAEADDFWSRDLTTGFASGQKESDIGRRLSS